MMMTMVMVEPRWMAAPVQFCPNSHLLEFEALQVGIGWLGTIMVIILMNTAANDDYIEEQSFDSVRLSPLIRECQTCRCVKNCGRQKKKFAVVGRKKQKSESGRD